MTILNFTSRQVIEQRQRCEYLSREIEIVKMENLEMYNLCMALSQQLVNQDKRAMNLSTSNC